MPDTLSPSERSQRARLAAHTSWARTADATARTAPARAAGPGSLAYWERKVDPEGELPKAERRRRAEHLRSAHYARMGLKSAKARRKKARAS